MQQNFDWKRFWCPPEGKLGLDELGFLHNPEDKYFEYIESDAVPFEKIQSTPCLILLGEPGIGKSNAIETEKNTLDLKIDKENELILYKNLKDYNSEEYLRKNIFESKEWIKFKEGNLNLHFFLDSLDEVRVRIHSVTRLILNELKETATDRLFLRIICRTAEWPLSFQIGLSQLWEKNKVKVYELTPLRLKDIETASEILKINSNDFIHAISEKNAGALASKPVTLHFLLDLFKKDGQFPKSRFDLYEKGCWLLCKEPDPERSEKENLNKEYVGKFTSEQRFIAASRIASILACCNNVAVQKDSLYSEIQEGCATVNELIGGKEKSNSELFNITEDVIKETLATGLFSSRGQNLLGFAHQTYQEFLAARYLKDVPFEQVKSLLFHPHDENKIIPQLYETTAWLAGHRQDIFSHILKTEPEILLRSDVDILDDKHKENLTAALLEKFKSEEIIDQREFYQHYKKLSHNKIASQLKPYITDKKLPFIARRSSIDIAEECNVKELQEFLVNIALNQEEPYDVRSQAANAVWKIADDKVKEKLEPLAKGEAGDDPDDELRGIGMRCMWSNKWNTLNLFKNITPPQKESYYGSYVHFLKHEAPPTIANKILDDEIPKILSIIKEWKIIKESDLDLSYLAEIYDEIFKLAWAKIPDRQVIEELSEIILSRIKKYQPIHGAKESNLWSQLTADTDKKRAIIKFIIENNKIDEKNVTTLAFHKTPLVTDSDFLWLLDEIEKANSSHQILWADLIMWRLREDLPTDYTNKFLEVRGRVPLLQEKYYTFWEIDSKLARDAKASYLRRERWERESAPKPLNPPIPERIDETLKNIESGHYDKWYDLVQLLSVNQETGVGHEWPSRLQDTPGWETIDKPKQKQVIAAAKNFLLNCESTNYDWFGKGPWPWSYNSIQVAILLIYDNKIIDEIPHDTWKKFVPHMVDGTLSFDNNERYCVLFNLAYEKAQAETQKYFVELLQIKNEKDGRIHFINYLKDCWNHKLNPVLLEQLQLFDIKSGSFEEIVDFFEDINAPETEEIVTSHLSSNKSNNPKLFSKAVELTLKYWGGKYWSQIIEIFRRHPQIAEEVIGNIADSQRHITKYSIHLDESKMAELYLLIHEKFPPEADSPLEGGWIGTREHIRDLRLAIFNHLINRGTSQACAAIESLIKKIPKQGRWMRWRLNEAVTNTLKKTWIPPTPLQIIRMLQDRHRRYVENEEQLLSVVIESLHRMQEDLNKNSTPRERFWNYDKNGNKRCKFRPIDEDGLSGEIEYWLKNDLSQSKGIIVNREVQIRREQKTDIHIDAIKLTPKLDEAVQQLTIVIEVKGCWHNDVKSAMKSQLYQRYMKKNSISCGLYIVGWFMCKLWVEDDRKRKTPKVPFKEFQEYLDNQAEKLRKQSSDIKDLKAFCLDVSLQPS